VQLQCSYSAVTVRKTPVKAGKNYTFTYVIYTVQFYTTRSRATPRYLQCATRIVPASPAHHEIQETNTYASWRSHLPRVSTWLLLILRIFPIIKHKQLAPLYVSYPTEWTWSSAARGTHPPANRSRSSRSQPRHNSPVYYGQPARLTIYSQYYY
jgi:hypothetical protein